MLLTENNYYSPFDATGGSVTVGVQRSALPSESEIEGKSIFFLQNFSSMDSFINLRLPQVTPATSPLAQLGFSLPEILMMYEITILKGNGEC